MTRGRAILFAALAVAGALSPAAAPAHSLLVRSEPGRSATVTRAPERVKLWFGERIEPAYAKLSVWSEAGKQVDAGDAAVAPNEPALLSVTTPDLGLQIERDVGGLAHQEAFFAGEPAVCGRRLAQYIQHLLHAQSFACPERKRFRRGLDERREPEIDR